MIPLRNDKAAIIPIKLGIPDVGSRHQHETVLELGEEAQNFTPGYQFGGSLKDD